MAFPPSSLSLSLTRARVSFLLFLSPCSFSCFFRETCEKSVDTETGRLRETDEIVYLHCWGGHGRAGTVVCLLLHWLYELDASSALFRCQFLHDLRRIPIVVGSPQTQTQRDQARHTTGIRVQNS